MFTTYRQISGEDFINFSGLLRKHELYLETLKFWYLYWLSNKEDTQRTTSCTRSKEKIPRHSPLPHSTLDMHIEPKKIIPLGNCWVKTKLS